MDYLLQRRKITKTYEDKTFGDHLFLEGGAGLNVLSRTLNPSPQLEGAVGDWFTPEHAWRLGVRAGMNRIGDMKSKFASLSLDYMMNFNAIANATYTRPKRFEVYGLAGMDAVLSRRRSVSRYGWGFHLGLRGQYAFTPSTYIYLEPRAGFLSDGVGFSDAWRGVHPTASLSAGLGYRLQQGENRAHVGGETTKRLRGGEGVFGTILGGGSFLINGFPSTWKNYYGPTGRLRVGKWFDTNNALQVGLHAGYLKQGGGYENAKNIGLDLDYVLNLHNAFGGYKANRRWWVNGMVGASLNAADGEEAPKPYFGLGLGLQGNLGLAKGVSLVLEPRVDVYGNHFADRRTSVGKVDIAPSFLAGLNYTYLPSVYHPERENDEFESLAPHDNVFVEAAVGANIALMPNALRGPRIARYYLRPQIYLGLGKWFAPVHGARLWATTAETEYDWGRYYNHVSVGADYLLNLTNLITGYRERRKTELVAAVGMNITARQDKAGAFFGMNASLKGIWSPTELFSLYVEPRIQAYGKEFMPYSFRHGRFDMIGSVMVGGQVNLKGYDRASEEATMEEEGRRSYISVAAGIMNDSRNLHHKSYYGPAARVSYTQFFTPLSAYRVSVTGTARINPMNIATATAGLDYMTDLSAYTFGYNPDRLVDFLSFVGFNLGTDYGMGHFRFLSDLHFGGQVGFNVGSTARLYLEPQMAYCFSSRIEEEMRLPHWRPQLLLGLAYGLDRRGKASEVAELEKKRFVSLELGTGAYSGTVKAMKSE